MFDLNGRALALLFGVMLTMAQRTRLGVPGPVGSSSRSDPGIPGVSTGSRPIRRPEDVFTITRHGTTVGLCTERHSCRSLDCQPQRPLCYCDSQCNFFDDCCFISPSVCEQPPPTARYNSMENESLSCVSPNNGTNSYYLTNSCPSKSIDTPTGLLCADQNPEDSLTSIPCYGIRTGVHYRNIYCALCNGEDQADLLPWKVEVNCKNQPLRYNEATKLLQTSIANLGKVESELGCEISVEPLSGVDGVNMPRYCYPDAVSRCLTPQHPLSEACESYTAYTTVAEEKAYGTVFKNPHCALCNLPNGPGRIKFATDCREELPVFHLNAPIDDAFLRPPPVYIVPAGIPGIGGPDGSKGPSGKPDPPGGVPLPPISILFDFRSNVRVVRDGRLLAEKSVQCRSNEVFVPFDSKCRKLSCLKGYLLEENKCIPDLRSFGQECDNDTMLELTLSFCQSSQDSFGNDNDTSSLKDTHLCLQEFLGLDEGTIHVKMSPTPTPTNNCPGQNHFSFFINMTDGEMKDLSGLVASSLPEIPSCSMFATYTNWTLDLRQYCQNLLSSKCTGHWLNDSEYSLPTLNNTTLVYVNSTESWYHLGQTIIRATVQRRENLFEQFTGVQICAELPCPRVALNSSLFQDDSSDIGTLIYTHTGKTFTPDEYVRTKDGEIEVCSFYESASNVSNSTSTIFMEFSAPQQILSFIGNVISMLAAAVTFITYCLFKELRKRISLAIMALTACLFSAQLLLLVSGTATENPPACTVIAALGHFFWLSTVLWTAVLAFSLNRVFASVSRIRRLDADKAAFSRQAVFAFGVSMLIVLPCLIIHLCDCIDIPLSYGNQVVCWIGNGIVNLVAFGAPIGVTVLANTLLFALTVHGIRSSKKRARSLKSDKSEMQHRRQELFIYIRISSLMGFTWIFGFLAALSDVTALWYVFILLNSCQGLLIFLSFICNEKVWLLWKGLVLGRKDTENMSTSVTPSSRPEMQPKGPRHSGGMAASTASSKV